MVTNISVCRICVAPKERDKLFCCHIYLTERMVTLVMKKFLNVKRTPYDANVVTAVGNCGGGGGCGGAGK